jgi:mono/diheme cytochrome c family protein
MTDTPQPATPPAPRDRIDIFLDGAPEPLLSTTPPLNFDLDTSLLEDGPHVLRIEAYDSRGAKGVRTIDFSVRNGPGIAVSGIRQDDVLDGKIPVIVNAYGGTSAVDWEPSQAETPAPPPTWAWVLMILVAAFALFYGIRQWSPPEDFARTPTYGTFTGSAGPVEAAAAVALPATATGTNAPDRGVRPAGAPPATSGSGGTGKRQADGQTAALSATDAARGAAIYSANCAACHQATGQGLPNVFPPLAGDPLVTAADPSGHISTVLDGKQGSTINGVSYASPMPSFKAILSDADIAAVINHERTSWGNAAPIVTAADVAALRK